jgi:hypothetical protein
MQAEGKTFVEIGRELGITPSWACQWLKRARLRASGMERYGVALPRIQDILRRAGFNNRADVVQVVASGRLATLYVRGMGAGARAFILKEFSK